MKHLQSPVPNDAQTEPLFLQWLWEDFTEAQIIGLQADAPAIYAPLLSEPQPEVSLLFLLITCMLRNICLLSFVFNFPTSVTVEITLFQVRASAVFALGTLLDVGFASSRDSVVGDEEFDDDEKVRAEISIVKSLLSVVSDGSPLVRAEIAVGMSTLSQFHTIEFSIPSSSTISVHHFLKLLVIGVGFF